MLSGVVIAVSLERNENGLSWVVTGKREVSIFVCDDHGRIVKCRIQITEFYS